MSSAEPASLFSSGRSTVMIPTTGRIRSGRRRRGIIDARQMGEEVADWVKALAREVDPVHTLRFRRAFMLEKVRGYMETHLGARPKDVARALNMSERLASHYVLMLRREWSK